MRVAITGGSGSLGRALIGRLVRGGADRIVTFTRDEQKRAALARDFDWHPGFRVYAGDVRDERRMADIFAGCEVVVHAAARKVVTAHPDEPEELLKTNVLGTVNVIDACRTAAVQKLIVISSDKACLDYHAPVLMASGEKIPIRRLVADRSFAAVQSLSAEGLVTRPVTGWYKTALAERNMFGVSYEDGPRTGRGRCWAWMTGDHPVLTTVGWVRADALTKKHLLVTGERMPDSRLFGAVVGWLLGDAHLARHGAQLHIGHAADQLEWVELARAAMSEFSPGPISVSSVNCEGRQPFHGFSVPCSSFLRKLRTIFYPMGRKRVPADLVREAYSPEMLAAWYLDDGCRADRAARFATHGFPEEDVEMLAQLLTSHGLTSRAYPCTAAGHRYVELRLTTEASYRFYEIVGRYVPPTMRHKVPTWAPPFDEKSWQMPASVPFIAAPLIRRSQLVVAASRKNLPMPGANKGKLKCLRGHDLVGDNVRMTSAGSRQCKRCVRERTRLQLRSGIRGRRDVYCIDVADTKNFIVNGVVVHNCRAENIYGISKAMAEHLAVMANARTLPKGLRIGVVRYGNVIGSNGSVVPLWRRLIAEGKPIPLSDPAMTRFWITLGQAVDLVLEAVANLRGGEVIVPVLPAAPILTLAAALMPDGRPVETAAIGIRQGGEKLHEELLAPQEVARAVRREGMFGTITVPPWQNRDMWDDRPWLGEPLPADTVYRSDVWPIRLDVDGMRRLLAVAEASA